jgi:nicotinamidase-related amidase
MAHENTAILLIDPYNDYIHPSGKMYHLCKESLETTSTIQHMKTLVQAARAHHIPIFYCLHQPWKEGNYDGWQRMGPFHKMLKEKMVCEEGSWGAGIFEGLEPDVEGGDVVVGKHWNARCVYL